MTVFRNDKFLSTSPDRGLSPVENPVSKLEGVKESETCGGRRHEGCDVGTTVRLMDHTKNVRRGNVRRSAENLRCASAATPNGLRGLAEAAVLTISLVREEFPRASSTLFAPPHRRRSLKSSHDSRATHAREDAARAVSHTPRFRRDAPRPDRRNSWSFELWLSPPPRPPSGSPRAPPRPRAPLPDPARRSAVSARG